jgi:hypothetical protein
VAHRKALTSWLTLAPHNNISGGRLLSSKTQPSANRAAGILRLAAMSLGRTETALGAFYRRLAYPVGKAKAITATAPKLAILVSRTLKDRLVYQDPGAAAYDAHHRTRVSRRLRQRAANLGFTLVDHAPARCSRVQFLRRSRHQRPPRPFPAPPFRGHLAPSPARGPPLEPQAQLRLGDPGGPACPTPLAHYRASAE